MPMDTTYGVRYNYGNPESSIKRRNPQPSAIGQGFKETRKSDPTLTGADPLNGLQAGRSTPKQTTDHKGPATAMGISLTPSHPMPRGSEGWINVAREAEEDRSMTMALPGRLPAEQLRDQLSGIPGRGQHRSVQRALKELEEQNQIRRGNSGSTDTRGTTGMRYPSRRSNSWHGHPRQSQENSSRNDQDQQRSASNRQGRRVRFYTL